jgi:hypothetical protein
VTIETTSSARARRNRLIAIAAGLLTIVAMVLGFAGSVLGLGWHWMQPAGELLLLAELVGLVVLERHQLFEPVHEKVTAMGADLTDVRATLGLVTQQLGASGQMTFYSNSHELLQTLARTSHEVFSRDQEAPQIFRIARLMGEPYRWIGHDPEFTADFESWVKGYSSGILSTGGRADSRNRLWSIRGVVAVASIASLNRLCERDLAQAAELKAINYEAKYFCKANAEPTLSPTIVTDREAVVVFDDQSANFRWGIQFQGRKTSTFFVQWFDDLWASIPDTHLVYSRKGLNHQALDLIRKELEALESARLVTAPEHSSYGTKPDEP